MYSGSFVFYDSDISTVLTQSGILELKSRFMSR